ncbi:MAG TPA: endolytic transglycosylase MltG [Solirubrobacterales bacterium]|nr:endolytic transglycosylase MltG [Solirubrobacterales bacterium]
MSDDWLKDDPFADPGDPAAREREQRRREREEKRQQRAAKQAPAEEKATPPPPQQPPKEDDPLPPPVDPAPPRPPRSPEQEFWDEEPEPQPEPVVPPVVTEPVYHDEGDPEMAGAARNGRRSGDGGGKRRPGFLGAIARHPFRVFGVIALIFVAWFLIELFQPFHGAGNGRVQVNVPKGASVSEVGDLLSEKGVIDSSTLFQIRVTLAGKRSEIYSGHFTLAHEMSYGEAIDELSQPPVKRTVTVTIPEGYTRSQAAQLVEEDGVPGSYTKATVKSKYLNPAKYGGKGAKDLEGFLFPDTFELKPGAPVADLVQLQLQDFKRRIKGVNMSYAKSKNLTVFDVLTIASMVQREAGVSSQFKQVASVIYNRLHEGMPLGIDATIRFATGNYTKPLTESELATSSPYNTRTNAGLPPGPIGNPGLEAIEAAAHPAKTDYLFYVTTPGACGKLTFAKTEAEFEAAVEKYNSAREAAGGNSPTNCGE